MNAVETIKGIKEIASKNGKRHKSQRTRFVTEEKIAIGECFRQGDIYIFRVGSDHPVGEKVERNQVADGVSVGARHILNGEFIVYEGARGNLDLDDVHSRICVGYAFDASATTVLTHPEHDNYVFRFPSRWQVFHQVDRRTLRRAAD